MCNHVRAELQRHTAHLLHLGRKCALARRASQRVSYRAWPICDGDEAGALKRRRRIAGDIERRKGLPCHGHAAAFARRLASPRLGRLVARAHPVRLHLGQPALWLLAEGVVVRWRRAERLSGASGSSHAVTRGGARGVLRSDPQRGLARRLRSLQLLRRRLRRFSCGRRPARKHMCRQGAWMVTIAAQSASWAAPRRGSTAVYRGDQAAVALRWSPERPTCASPRGLGPLVTSSAAASTTRLT